MPYPTTIQEFRDVLLAYTPAETEEAAIYAAQAHASPVRQAVDVFEALKAAEGLSNEGLGLLLGAAHLIAAGSWHGLAPEAVALIAARASEYADA